MSDGMTEAMYREQKKNKEKRARKSISEKKELIEKIMEQLRADYFALEEALEDLGIL